MMAVSWIHSLRALGAATALTLTSHLAVAEMLDEPACNQLKNEQQRLAAEGLKTEMLHGPDWAKANLPNSRLEEIKHLMEVEEQIAFRCPLPPPPKAAEPAAASPDEDGAVPKATKRKKAKKSEEATAPDAPADQPAPKPPKRKAVDAPPSDGDPAPKPQKKKKAAAKKQESGNDAYVPPSPTGNAFVDGEAEPVPQPPAGASSKQLAP